MTDSEKISITNFTITETHNVAKITISVSNLILHTSADVFVTFYNENDVFVKHKLYKLEGEHYTAWGNNDNYIIEWILAEENKN